MSDAVPKTFEAKLDRIDAIVKELESGRTDLDRAIVLFKEGKTLARECETLLRDAQAQIDGAMGEPTERDGEPQVPF
jgi:exodeoxyribonuclease VII small subunit